MEESVNEILYSISDEFRPDDSESDDEETIAKDEEGIDEVDVELAFSSTISHFLAFADI